jgi:hypothetical protein
MVINSKNLAVSALFSSRILAISNSKFRISAPMLSRPPGKDCEWAELRRSGVCSRDSRSLCTSSDSERNLLTSPSRD